MRTARYRSGSSMNKTEQKVATRRPEASVTSSGVAHVPEILSPVIVNSFFFMSATPLLGGSLASQNAFLDKGLMAPRKKIKPIKHERIPAEGCYRCCKTDNGRREIKARKPA